VVGGWWLGQKTESAWFGVSDKIQETENGFFFQNSILNSFDAQNTTAVQL
jgi:hypothetical protein